jgi:hypothetical protein
VVGWTGHADVTKDERAKIDALRACLDGFAGRYQALRGVDSFEGYLASKGSADEEILTEPVLAALVERVLGFTAGAYFPQFGKGGLKPDLTPTDLIAHRFVLDAKSSDENLARHEAQIRRYISQRSLDFGVLFNLKELRVYRAHETGHHSALSFRLLPVWQVARDEALRGPETDAFLEFCRLFAYRELDVRAKVAHVREQPSWATRIAAGEPVQVDVEFLVSQLRELARVLADDAAAQAATRICAFVSLGPGREERLLDELRLLALDLQPGIDVDTLPATLDDWRRGSGLSARVWRQYLLRVAYLALTRILLYRAWEDVQFVDEYLYDGGFDLEYERLDGSVRRVLGEAFAKGAQRYRSLFGADNNYVWFKPRDPALVEVLYRLAPVPLGKLDADVLGALYVSYVDEIDRDRLGQFFTPRPVVRFMLDRAGFRAPDGVFRVQGDERNPLRVFDFATGSGGFLVEAARRVIDEGVSPDDPKGLQEALRAVARGFVGGEISPFPYYLTEINLLLQISRLLGRLKLAGEDPPDFVLGVMRIDSLAAKSGGPGASIQGLEPGQRSDRAELERHDIFDIVPLEPEKHATYRELRQDGTFDLVVGNPPYVKEANNKLLFEHLRSIAAWNGIYRGKTDYLYYFLWLAVEKLKPGGRLCIITPAAWMNAGAADFLRKKMASELQLDELFLFGSYRLFADEQGPAPTPVVESAILVATKARAPANHRLRVVVLEDQRLAGQPDREALLEEMSRRATARSARRAGMLSHYVRQIELEAQYPWPVKFPASGTHMRVVRHLKRSLRDNGSPVEPLAHGWKVFTGIETGADAYTERIRRNLPASVLSAVEENGGRIGDPVMELPAARVLAKPWRKHPAVLARSPEPAAVLYGALDEADDVYYVLIDRTDDPPREVKEALEPWKPLLEHRAEIRRNPNRRWFETAWPRSQADLEAPKVIALYRTDRGRFALDEKGEWKPGKKATVVVARTESGPVAYLCGLLNSELLDLWYAVRGKAPRDVWRNYEPKRMNEIPYRRPDGDPRVEQVAEFVREVASNRRALLPHRPVVLGLGRTIKDPWKTGPVEIDRSALMTELSADAAVSVRTDALLEVIVRETPLGSARRESEAALIFRRGRTEAGRVTGDPRRLDLLETLLGTGRVDDVRGVLLPRDLDTFEQRAQKRAQEVSALLIEGRRLVEEVERLVCELYGLPDELTDAVIAHAAQRAGSTNPTEAG